MKVRAGDLREPLAFDAPVQSSDGSGGVKTGWQESFKRRGHVRYLRGGEAVQAARLASKQPAVFTIRADAQTKLMDASWRLRDLREQAISASRGIFNITAIVHSEDRLWLEITAESGVAV